MIFFLANNNYHIELDLKLAKQLHSYELGLIQVPHSLNIIYQDPLFKKIFCLNYRFHASLIRFFSHPFKLTKIKKHIDRELLIDKNDIILVHTEIDLINQYVIQKFYERQAKVFLLEDGTSTMCTYNLVPQKAGLKDRIKTIILRLFYNYKYTKIAKYGKQILPVMNDSVFSGVIVNFGNSILRNIPLSKLTPINEPIEILSKNGAVFYSQPLYLWYLKEDEYISFVSEVLIVSIFFDQFYFKFHPSDNEYVKAIITKLIREKFNKIIIITESDIAENIIYKYPVRYAITFNSTAALNLINRGIVPVFLNNIFNNYFPDSSFLAFSQFLKSINCQVPATLSDVKPGFCAFLNGIDNSNTKSILDILK